MQTLRAASYKSVCFQRISMGFEYVQQKSNEEHLAYFVAVI